MKTTLRRLKRWLKNVTGFGPAPGADGFLYGWINAKLLEMVDAGLRAPYAWGMLQGACLAAALGIDRVSVVEFGVAGGNGLVAMEGIAERIEKLVNVRIDIYGFDSGEGLPPPTDYRDVPNLCSSGLYRMDQERLRSRLRRSRLFLGDIGDTISEFMASRPAPLAFIACDVIIYTSTASALRIFDSDEKALLPRVHCYFDDVLGFTYGDYNGERLAIHEFNDARATTKLSPIYGLKYYVPEQTSHMMWVEKFWMAHVFNHALYAKRDHLVQGHNLDLNA